MKRNLGGLGEGPQKQEDQDAEVKSMVVDRRALVDDLRDARRARGEAEKNETGEKGERARPGQEQRLQRIAPSLFGFVGEPDQQVGRDRRQFPEDEEQDEVVGEDETE